MKRIQPFVSNNTASNREIHPGRSIIKAGLSYFALVFGAGFILGSLRVPFLAPRLGERMAELIEMPFMFIVVWLSARFIVRRFALPVALGLLLASEILLAVVLQDLCSARTSPAAIRFPEPFTWSCWCCSP